MSLSFKDNYIPHEKFKWDFSLSSNPFGPSFRVKERLIQAISTDACLSSYPEENYPELTKAIASFYQCSEEEIILGTGVDGLIFDIISLLLEPQNELILPEVTFRNAIYAANLKNALVTQIPMHLDLSVDFDQLIRIISPKTKIIFLCNPNNPTGIYESLESIRRLLESTNALVIVDEANIEFSKESALALTKQFPHLMVLRSFSKAYGLAGIRVGYGISRSFLLKKIKETRPPFFLSTLSAIAACSALSDQNHLLKTVAKIIQERKFLEKELELLGFKIIPSSSNTLLCHIPKGIQSASDLLESLNQHDCHVINGTHYNLKDCYLRIAPRLHEVNERLVQILKTILIGTQ